MKLSRSWLSTFGSLIIFLSPFGHEVRAQVSGIWSGSGSNWSATCGAVTISTSATGAMGAFSAGTLGCAGAYSTSAVDGGPSLVVNYNDLFQPGTLTFTFSHPVTNPVLHLDRLGGHVLLTLLATSARITISDPGVTWTELSENGSHFNSTGTTVLRTLGVVTTGSPECGTPFLFLLGATASGSLRVNGTITSLTLAYDGAPGLPLGNPGDEMEFAWSNISQPPVALDDGFTMNEDGTLNASVAGNDTDADNLPAELVWSLLNGGTAAANGSLNLNANGSFSYSPNTNFNGPVSFTYRVCDPNGACDEATVSIGITAINDQPTAGDDVFVMNEDATLNATVATNDSDPETPNSGLTWSLLSGGTAAVHGNLVLQPDGSFSYTPTANYSGVVSFTYHVCDPSSACDPATATITIQPVNDAPQPADDSYVMDEDGTLSANVGTNDSDVDDPHGTLIWTLTDPGTAAANGMITLATTGALSYSPSADRFGSFSFGYTVCDPSGACASATVTINVVPVNDAPIAVDDGWDMYEDGVANTSVATNDSDVDNTSSELAWSIVNGGTATANGVLSLLPNGSVNYAPAPSVHGSFWFTYQVCDPGGACAIATAFINVDAVNDAPIAFTDLFTMSEDGTLSGVVGDNDTDIDDPHPSLIWGLVDGGTAVASGALSFLPDGSFDYVPDPGFNGMVSFVYSVCDPGGLCDTAIATIDVGSENDAPIALNDDFLVLEDGILNDVVYLNDTDPDADELSFGLVSGGSAVAFGALTIQTDGSFTYVPFADVNGVVSFTYQACDPSNVCDAAVVTITIQPVNDPPIANDDVFSIAEDGVLNASVAVNDSDVDDAQAQLTWTLVSGGTAVLNGTLNLNSDGTITFAPFGDVNGSFTFVYEVCDPNGSCDQATGTVQVLPLNDAPIAGNDGFTMNEDDVLNASVTDNDLDVDDGGSLIWSLQNGGSAALNGNLVMSADGSFTFIPATDLSGTFSFSYQVCDPHGACASATVLIDVLPVNDLPVAVDDAFTLDEESTIANTVAANDVDVDDAVLTFSLTDAGSAGVAGVLAFDQNGSFTFTGATDVHGTFTFSYSVCDAEGCDEAVVTLTILPINDSPVGADDLFVMNEDDTHFDDVRANDGDVENDPLTWVLTDGGTATANGTLMFEPDGSFSYTPNTNFHGLVSFTYSICDDAPACDQAIATIHILPVNDAPIATADAFVIDEDEVLSATVSANDADVDNTYVQLNWSLADGGTAAANGTLSVNNDGTFTYTPQDGFHGVVSFTYALCDLEPLCDTATVTITIVPIPDDPVITDPDGVPVDTLWFSTWEDTPILLCIDAVDEDGDLISITQVNGGPANGSISGVGDGTLCITYMPQADFNGADGWSVVVCDDGMACDTVWVVMTVLPVNDPPVAVDDAFELDEDAILSASVGGNDVDPDNSNAELSWSLADGGTAAANGSLSVNNDGTFTYTPQDGFHGVVSFTYALCDLEPLCDTATVSITINAVPDDPVITDPDGVPVDTLWFSTWEDTPILLCIDAVDEDGDLISITEVNGGPANGSISGLGDGSLCITYMPQADFNGTDGWAVVVCDDGMACDTVWVVMTVFPVNDPPVAMDDAFELDEDEILPASVAGNDVDPDNSNVQLNWSLADGGTAAANGSLSVNNDGTFTYTPQDGFHGVVSFTYALCDLEPLCDTATVTITINAVPDDPVITDPDGVPVDTLWFSTWEDTPILLCIDAVDEDGDTISITQVNGGPANGSISGVGDGTLCITYMPQADFNGTDGWAVVVCDDGMACDTVWVVMTVLPVNDPPVAVDDAFELDEDEILPASVAGNDVDPDNSSAELNWSLADGGTAAANGSLSVNNDGTFTYTPQDGFHGVVSFTYALCDLEPLCDTATVTITIVPIPDDPVITDPDGVPVDTLWFSTWEDTPILLCIDAVDEDGDLISITQVNGGPANGSISGVGDGTLCITYMPQADFNGADGWSVVVCDDGMACDTVWVVMTVLPVNDPPVAVDEVTSTEQGVPVAIDILENDSDPDGDPINVATANAQNGTVTINGNGSILYTPDPLFCGQDTITYTICDLEPLCASANVMVNVICTANQPPIAVDDNASTEQGVPVAIDILENDSDPDGDPINVATANAQNGTVTINGNGTITYNPDPLFCGVDSITYTICDPEPLCASANVMVNVTCVANDPPIAVDDNASTEQGVPVAIDILENDSDPDGDPINVATANAQNGTVIINGNGTITYTPDPLFCGVDTITYTICDPEPLCASANVMVNVICTPNQPPIAVNDNASTDQGSSVAIDILENDSDPDGDPINVATANAQNGTATINGNGSITYTPDPLFCGEDTITYTICDLEPLCASANVMVNVICTENQPPIAVNDNASTDQGSSVAIDILENDSDPDGDPINVATANAQNGTATINGNGSITYTPDPLFCGEDTITYTICDLEPLCASANVLVNVICPISIPFAIPSGFSPNGDGIADTWVVSGSERYPNASLTVINRWGAEVYKAAPYRNDWDGTSNSGFGGGGPLPAGTYWYLFDPSNGEDALITGYIQLVR